MKRYKTSIGAYECAPIAIFNAIRYKYPYFDEKKYSNIKRRCKTGKHCRGTMFRDIDDTIKNYHEYFDNISLIAGVKSQRTLWDQLNHHIVKTNRSAIVSLISKKSGLIEGMSHSVLFTDIDKEKYNIVGLDCWSFKQKHIEKYFDISTMWILFYEEEKQKMGHYLSFDEIELDGHKFPLKSYKDFCPGR